MVLLQLLDQTKTAILTLVCQQCAQIPVTKIGTTW